MSIVIILLAFYFFTDIISYVLVSFVLSVIGQPIMRFLLNKLKFKKLKIGSALAAILTMMLFIIIFLLFFSMFVPLIVQQAGQLVDLDYGKISQALEDPLMQFQDYLVQFGFTIEQKSSEDMVQEALTGLFNPNKLGDFFSSILGFASGFFMTIFSICFITFFFLQEQGMLKNFIVALVPTKYEERVRNVMDETIYLLTRYFTGILIQITIITTYVSLALSLFGVESALLIGFFAAIINVIPYLGPLIGAAFGVLVTLSLNVDADFYAQTLSLIIKVIIVFASMQLIDNFILQPWIFSNSVLAHPLEIFIVILVAAKIGGIVGMVLAIPVYTMLRVVSRTFLSEFKIVQKITQGMQKE
jgi:predicted PurR-regulated permease PerM